MVQREPVFNRDTRYARKQPDNSGMRLIRRYLFVPSQNDVKVFSTKTGNLTRLLKGHTGTVTEVFINPENVLQVISRYISPCH